MMWNTDGWWCGGGWGAGTWLTLVGLIVLTVAVTLLVVSLVRSPSRSEAAGAVTAYGRPTTSELTHSPAAQRPRETARDILARRYAAGEIDRDEYLQKLADLGS